MRRLVAVISPWFRQAHLYLWHEQESGPLWRGRRRCRQTSWCRMTCPARMRWIGRSSGL